MSQAVDAPVSLQQDITEMLDKAAEIERPALLDALRLAAEAQLPRPDLTSVSDEGVLLIEWDRGDAAGFVLVFSGSLEAAWAARFAMYFDVARDFRVDEGFPSEARAALDRVILVVAKP